MAPRLGWLLTAAWCVVGIPGTAGAKPDTDQLPAARAIPILTQQLMSALPGGAAVWRRLLSDHAVYVSEAGEVLGKEELIKEFAPFPQGLSGVIHVKNCRVTELGDLALSVFDADEKELVYGQAIEVGYRSTHTWRREGGRWRLLAAQALVLAKDPDPLPVDTRRLSEFTGTYEMGTRRYRVETHGHTLVGGREGGPFTPLIGVGDNVFADAGSNLGILRIFVRGPSGAVDRMVQRRKYADLDWRRVPADGSATPSK